MDKDYNIIIISCNVAGQTRGIAYNGADCVSMAEAGKIDGLNARRMTDRDTIPPGSHPGTDPPAPLLRPPYIHYAPNFMISRKISKG
jgi:hypothetical protein